MAVPLERLPAAVVACPVRAAAAVVRWVAERSGFVPELSADEIVAEELAAWSWPDA